MNNNLHKLKQVLDETINLSHENRPGYMASVQQLITVFQAALAVLEEQEARIKAIEDRQSA